MSVKEILIEYSSRLQVANFFILFSKPIADTKSVKINLKPSDITIQFDSDCVTLQLIDHFQLETCSLSSLNIDTNNISFRLNTNNENSFHLEYLNLNNNELPLKPLKLKLNVEANKNFQILCSNCTCPLTAIQNFRRILELPSENLDLNEWFCHKHHETTESTEGQNNPIESKEKFNFAKFSLRDTDLLYGQFFFLFNLTKLLNVKKKNKFIYCRRCLQSIGEVIRDDDTVKIWDENIQIYSKLESTPLFDGLSILKNFIFIIQKNIQDFEFMSIAGLPATNKILFETKCSNGENIFLLLQIMNKNLELFTLFSLVEGKVKLKQLSGMKIFYRIESDETRPMVKFWQNDVGCSNIQISKKMFDEAIDTLNEYSNYVPTSYRNMGGFTISYLHL